LIISQEYTSTHLQDGQRFLAYRQCTNEDLVLKVSIVDISQGQ